MPGTATNFTAVLHPWKPICRLARYTSTETLWSGCEPKSAGRPRGKGDASQRLPSWCLIALATQLMVAENQFRRILPLSQTALALFLGGWGLWIRNSILSQPFVGNSSLWNSTARFHVWPWPYKFAVVLNIPAFLMGLLLSWPLDALWPGLPESVSYLPVLLLIPLLWYLVGLWLDKRSSAGRNKRAREAMWVLLLLFIAVCAATASIPSSVWGYINYLYFGPAIWMTVAVGMTASAALRRYKSKTA